MFHRTRTWFSMMLAVSGALWGQEVFVDLGVGYRQDSLTWSLAGPGGVPSTLSTLSWRDVKSVDVQAEVEALFCDRYYLRADANYGFIYQGHNTDKDYTVDQETSQDLLFFQSAAHAGKGGVWDASIGGTWLSRCFCGCFEVRPLVGVSVHSQRLRMYDGVIVVDIFEPGNEGYKFPELDSRYTTYWSGPWTGFDLSYFGAPCWTFSTSQELHALYYDAKGHWNLREDILGDFHHHGWGWGYFTKVSISYEIACGWQLGVQCKYNYCRMNDGRDKSTVILSDPQYQQQTAQAVTKIKHAIWDSYAGLVTLGYSF